MVIIEDSPTGRKIIDVTKLNDDDLKKYDINLEAKQEIYKRAKTAAATIDARVKAIEVYLEAII